MMNYLTAIQSVTRDAIETIKAGSVGSTGSSNKWHPSCFASNVPG